MVDVKFCGLTRADDARVGASLGAAYLGVIFAGGPRKQDADSASAIFAGAAGGGRIRRVGVFGDQPAAVMLEVARAVDLDVVQLHGASAPVLVDELRRSFGGEVWRVVRLRGDAPAQSLRSASEGVDALLVDALADGALGGTGVAVDWEGVAEALVRYGRPPRLVLAGGLGPSNVERAIGLVSPDVVDVSSGVESAPGIKDHALMRAFAEATTRGGR